MDQGSPGRCRAEGVAWGFFFAPRRLKAKHGTRARTRWAALGLAVVAAVAAPGASRAQAEAVPAERGAADRLYDIAPGPLGSALAAFAGQSGINFSAPPALTDGRASGGLRGRYTLEQGFERLLRDSGLEAVMTGAGRYTLRARPGRAPVAALSTIQVLGQGEADPKDEVYRTPGSRSVLSRDDIERFRGTSVGDIFQGVPGVLVGENRNSGGLDINIRGMQGQGRVPVLIDGARQETTVYRGYAGVSSRSYVDPDLIGGITIDKGPTLDAAGTGAVGGLVSMNTIRADDILKPGKTLGIRLRGTLMSNNSGSAAPVGTPAGYFLTTNELRTNCVSPSDCQGKHDPALMSAPGETLDRPGLLQPKSGAGSVAIAKRTEWADLVAAYAQRSQGNYYSGTHGPVGYLNLSKTRDRGFYTEVIPVLEGATRFRGGERIINTNYASRSTLLKAKVFMPRDHELELSWMRYASEYGQLMPSQLRGFDYARQTQDSEVRVDTYASRYRWNPAGADWLDLRANLWHTRTRAKMHSYEGVLNESGIPSLYGAGETECYKRTGLDLSNTSTYRAWGGGQWRYGLAWQTEDVHSEAGEGSGNVEGRDGKRDEYSAFVALKHTLLPSLTLDAGGRYTRYEAKDRKRQTVCDDAASGCVEKSNGGFAPLASLTWEPVQGLQFYGRYAQALRMPSMFETTAGWSASARVDVNLKPERITNREAGINFMKDGAFVAGDQLRLKASLFRNVTHDYLTRVPNDAWETSGEWTIRNIDRVALRGIELGGSYDAGSFYVQFGGTRYSNIETCHRGSYRRQVCTDFGIAVSYVNNMIPPNWHASLVLGTRWLDRRLEVGARTTLMGKRNNLPEYDTENVDSGYATPVPWHAYTLVDLFMRYRVNDHVSVDFNIDNATDRYYLDALSLGLVPAPGRTARLSVTLMF